MGENWTDLRGTPTTPRRRRNVGVALCFTLVSVLVAGEGRAGKNIFDEDWEPPRAPAPTPTARPPVAPPASAPAKAPGEAAPPAITPTPSPTREPVPAPALARKPTPAPPDQARSRALLRQVYAEQLNDRSLPGRRKLADTLIDAAAKAADNASDQYVLLGGAITAAQEAASLPLWARAAGLLADQYEVDGVALKAATALKVPLRADTPAATLENVRAGLALVDELASAENFAAAARLCAALQPVAAADAQLRATVQSQFKEVEATRVAQQRVAPHLDRLKMTPNDPAANLAVGRYLCFDRGRWDQGLPLLAKGSDPSVKALAASEAAKPSDAAAMAALGDGWWDAAEREPVPVRDQIRARAAHWYQSATAGLTGLAKLRVEKRLAEAAAAGVGPFAGMAAPLTVRIIKADYGCGNPRVDVTAKIQEALRRDPLTPIGAINELAGRDPCSGWVKNLYVQYALGDGTAKPQEARVGENGLILLPPAPAEGVPVRGVGQGFAVLAARYGAGLTWVDVTKLVRERATGPTQPFDLTNEDAGGDPAFKAKKHLVVWFRHQGRRHVSIFGESWSWGIRGATLVKEAKPPS